MTNQTSKMFASKAAKKDLPKLRPHIYSPLSTNQGTFIVNQKDVMRVEGKGSFGVGHQLLNYGAFDTQEVQNALKLLEVRRHFYGPKLMAIDCGANVGVHAISWARALWPHGDVIAIEAQERIFYALCGAILLNNCHNARALWAAVGRKKGQVTFHEPNYFKQSSFGSFSLVEGKSSDMGQDPSEGKLQTVTLLSIDSLNLDRLDFIKIDIEGMEEEAIQGAKKSIKKFKPILLVEHIKSDKNVLFRLLQDLGYDVHPLGINLLCVHKDCLTHQAVRIHNMNK
jgi:FkbM family methyltransferase